ncbi:MAG: hypothetical protein RSB55_08185 [Oscillospiraceae bacterium]
MENNNLIAVAGLKKLRVAQILSVIAVILTAVGAIMALSGAVVAGGTAMDSGAASIGALATAGAGGLMTIAGLIVALVSFIMELVGLVKIGPAHINYKYALYAVLANIALGVVGIFVMGFPVVSAILQAASPILVFLTVYFVLSATITLLREKGDEAAAAKGTTLRTVYLVCTAVDVAGSLIVLVPALAGFANTATAISAVVQIVALFMYIGFLGRSIQTLSGTSSAAQ